MGEMRTSAGVRGLIARSMDEGLAVARATGVTMTGYYMGALATPVSFGALVDWLGTYTWAWLVMALGSTAAAACFARANRVGDVVS